ncbi:MAG: amidohydrolase, partial [candidate division Zixibacteria bacterium]|nr:amidohydrolase [candidate division Zixibacteria bacterium]
MNSRILNLADKYYPSIRKLRRYLHQYPELSFEEKETAGKLREQLEPLGLKISKSIAGTGFTALLEGNRDGKVVAFRTDMDALPITE